MAMAKWSNPAKGPSYRRLRVSEMLRRALADVLSEGFPSDPDIPVVSITVCEVRLTSDLKRATVYVLPLGGRHSEEVVAGLNRDRPEIRRLLNQQIHLKYSPSLNFALDTRFDHVDEVERLLKSDAVQRDIRRQAAEAES